MQNGAFRLPAPGALLCTALGGAAWALSDFLPLGAVVLAILLGALVGNVVRPGEGYQPGIRFCEKTLLAVAIALMGVNLDFTILRTLGSEGALIVIAGVPVTLLAARVIGRWMKVDPKLALLLGSGNAICGSSAIAAVNGVIDAEEKDVGLSVAIVNFLGTVGIFLLPLYAQQAMGLTDLTSGVLAGNLLQAVGQVVAAGFSISDTAGQAATLIKMSRILMLFPVILILIALRKRRAREDAENDALAKHPGVPLFIIGFACFSLVPTFELLPPPWIKGVAQASKMALIVAMAGIGLRISAGSILRDGRQALLLAGLVFLIQIAFTSLMVLALFR